jgi:small subunit ribosomal protein S8e
MARSQHKSNRKASGGRYHGGRSKKKFELARFSANTRLSKESKVKSTRTLGGNTKESLLAANIVNVADKKGKSTKTEILNVIENPANPHLVRRNVLTKGAIVETKLGKVKITSRPGQEASVNGVLV